jgi:hypothetical protein
MMIDHEETSMSFHSTRGSPPPNLGKTGLTLWRSIRREIEPEDAGSFELLAQICLAEDRVAAISNQIAREGLTIESKHGLKEHPLLKSELGLRAFIARSLVKLRQSNRPGRPPSGGIGVTWKQLRGYDNGAHNSEAPSR